MVVKPKYKKLGLILGKSEKGDLDSQNVNVKSRLFRLYSNLLEQITIVSSLYV